MAKYKRKQKIASYYKKNTEAGIIDHNQKMMQAIVLKNKKDFVFHHSKGGDLNYIDDLGFSPLLLALIRGQQEIARYILSHKSEFNIFHQTYLKGYNALHCAVISESSAIIKELNLELLINGKTSDGDTALHLAVDRNNLVIVKRLIEYGIIVDERNDNGETALMMTIKRHYINKNVFHFILRHTNEINLKDVKGYTALMRAVEKGNEEYVEAVLENGANPNLVARNGKTAFSIARDKGYEDILKKLIEADKKMKSKSEE